MTQNRTLASPLVLLFFSAPFGLPFVALGPPFCSQIGSKMSPKHVPKSTKNGARHGASQYTQNHSFFSSPGSSKTCFSLGGCAQIETCSISARALKKPSIFTENRPQNRHFGLPKSLRNASPSSRPFFDTFSTPGRPFWSPPGFGRVPESAPGWPFSSPFFDVKKKVLF